MRLQQNSVYLLLLIALISCLSACAPKPEVSESESEGSAEKAKGIEKVTERGPIKVTVKVDKEKPTIADRIELELVVEHEEDYEVRLPRFGEKLDQFAIVDFGGVPESLTDDGRIRTGRTYELEPFLSGDYVIPPMEIRFQKLGEEKEHVLESEAIELTVSSVLDGTDVRTEIHDIMGPMDVPAPPRQFQWWYVLVGVLIAGVAVWALIHLGARKKSPPPLIVRPAHEVAFERLAELGQAGLAEKGEFKAFFQEISGILRSYIEARYGLRATDQTTEEFLHAIRDADYLNGEHKVSLKSFMSLSDLVKFAEHEPTDADIQGAFDHCRDFITATAERPEDKVAEPSPTDSDKA